MSLVMSLMDRAEWQVQSRAALASVLPGYPAQQLRRKLVVEPGRQQERKTGSQSEKLVYTSEGLCSQAWWFLCVIPAPGRQRRKDHSSLQDHRGNQG